MGSIIGLLIFIFLINGIISVIRKTAAGENPFERFFKGRRPFQEYDENGGPVNKTVNPGNFPVKIVLALIVILFIGVSLSGAFYTVDQSEQALVFRFGAHQKTIDKPGLNFKIPYVDSVEFVNVEQVRRFEYGFRSNFEPEKTKVYSQDKYLNVNTEAIMITGDENLVDAEVIVQYRVVDPEAFLLNVDAPEETLHLAAYSRIRRVVANHTLDDILTLNKDAMQIEMKEDIQEISNKYGLGILITTVQLQDVDPPADVASAFTDVASAREDKERYINEARQYANKIIPEARAQKEKLLNEAEAYKNMRINQAQGDISRFIQVLEKYSVAKDITRKRMYIEAMGEILPKMDIYIVNKGNLTMLPVKGASTVPAEAAAGIQTNTLQGAQ